MQNVTVCSGAANIVGEVCIYRIKNTVSLVWVSALLITIVCAQAEMCMIVLSRGEANMLKILPIILFHSAHKLSLLFL